MKTLARPALRSAATSISTMAGVRIRALTERHPIKPTSPRCHSAWQLNLGRHSTYRRGKSVQTTGPPQLRYQPDSDLSVWFQTRVGTTKGRIRRIAIVALARKLLVALWRYLETGVVPRGAVLKG